MGKRLKRGYYRRGGVIWVRTDPITGRATSTGCRDPGAAELWRAERERLAASPQYAASLRASVGQWVLKTMELKGAQRSEGTAHMYGVKLGHVARIIGAESAMAAIDAGAVDAYIAQRRTEGAVSNTIARELTCLRQMLRLAKRAGAYAGDIDAIMPVGFSAEYVPVRRTLRREDLPRLLAKLGPAERAWVQFAIAFAADVSDIERARREDYDPVRGVMHLHGSKTRARNAPVPVLDSFRELAEAALPHLPLSWPRASKALGEACARAKLPHLSPKDLRRTAATWLIEDGVDQDLVSRFLRHHDSKMVRTVYGQLRPERLGELIDKQQNAYKNVTVIAGPLAESADAGDLKGNSAKSPDNDSRELAPLGGTENTHSGAVGRTKTLQPIATPGAWALALAAERVLVGVRWGTVVRRRRARRVG